MNKQWVSGQEKEGGNPLMESVRTPSYQITAFTEPTSGALAVQVT